VLIEQKLEQLLRSGLTASGRPAETSKTTLFRAPVVVERRTKALASSRPRPRVVIVGEEALAEFLATLEGVLRSDGRLARVRWARGRVSAALRAVLPTKLEVDPESPVAA
jgi:hypothetical protein